MNGRDEPAGEAVDVHARPAGAPVGLLAKLMAAVRPQFRVEDLYFDPRDPVFGAPPCAVVECIRPRRSLGICDGHRHRWLSCGRPDLAQFVATTTPYWHGRRPLGSCTIPGCRYGLRGHGLCIRHGEQWDRLARPDLPGWLASQAPLPPPVPTPDTCLIGQCNLWARGTSPFCATHDVRWRTCGHPDAAVFAAEYADPGPSVEHIDLSALPTQLRLEIAYTLQCRRDEATAKVHPRRVQPFVYALAGTGVSSLMDRTEDYWAAFTAPRTGRSRGQRAFLLDAYHRIEVLAFGQGWDSEYPRPMWRLRNLGRPSGTVDFRGIPQPRLNELAKRWARLRLTAGRSVGMLQSEARAVARFAGFLNRQGIPTDDLAGVDRALLERYLAELATELGGRQSHSRHVGALGRFLQAIHQHGWDDTLPAGTRLFAEDYPDHGRRLPRALSSQVMAQVERPDNLDRWRYPAYRLITLILIRAGLRISSAVGLTFDCLVYDADQAPHLRYYNTKMKREALVPIDDEIHDDIIAQQKRTITRFPAGCPVLFPRPHSNLDGRHPISTHTYRDALYRWLAACEINDEHGKPVHLTPHQWRHTLGTTLINRDVPQHVVQKILDHDSPQMTGHYARLSDTTIRRHWEAARKVNSQGETVTVDPGGPLAEAAWAKHRLGLATQALPNGYCGLPLVKKCEHANACLTCPMFLTTSEFLPQHRQQHQHTLEIITAAQARGQTRMATMNQEVADNLGKIIASLEAPSPEQDAADAS